MHIKYMINQHHCHKIKDYHHVDRQIKEHFNFQYIETCLNGYLFFFGDTEHKLSTLLC
jgi:hypothetical protein